MAGQISDVPGTRDVTLDLQRRTNLSIQDKLLMVNSETKEVQYVTPEQLGVIVGGDSPVFSDNLIFDI